MQGTHQPKISSKVRCGKQAGCGMTLTVRFHTSLSVFLEKLIASIEHIDQSA